MARTEESTNKWNRYFSNLLNDPQAQTEASEYSKCDMNEARDNATDYVIGSEDAIHDMCCGEFGNIDRLTFIMAKLAGSYGSDALYWLDQYKDELAAKLEKLIDARYEVELEKLYD